MRCSYKIHKKGEEITADYAKDNAPNLNMECNCGSKNCKGIVRNN